MNPLGRQVVDAIKDLHLEVGDIHIDTDQFIIDNTAIIAKLDDILAALGAGGTPTFQTVTCGASPTYVALATVAATKVTFMNDSGQDIEFLRGGAGAVFTLKAGYSKEFAVAANANELSVRGAAATAYNYETR